DELLGDHPVGDGAAVAVEVVEEGLQGADALGDAGGDPGPFVGVDHPRDRVDREGSLLPRVVEGDALVEIAAGEGLGAGAELLRSQPGQRVMQRPIGGAHGAVGGEHLVTVRSGAGAAEQRGVRHAYHSHTDLHPLVGAPPRKREPCRCSPGSAPSPDPSPAIPRCAAAHGTSGAPRSVPCRSSAAGPGRAPGSTTVLVPSPTVADRRRTACSPTAATERRSSWSTPRGTTTVPIRARSCGRGSTTRRTSPRARTVRSS